MSRFCNRVGRRAIGASAPAPRVPFGLALPTAPVVYTAVVEGGARVLVVEDEQSLATALVDGLTAEGFAVEVAADGTAGLRLARRSSYDLIVRDIVAAHGGTAEAADTDRGARLIVRLPAAGQQPVTAPPGRTP